MRKSKPDRVYYKDMQEVFHQGKYKGMTLEQIFEENPRYLFDSYYHGYINLSDELLLIAKRMRNEFVKSKDVSKCIAIQNAHNSKSKGSIELTERKIKECKTSELCIHEECYCAKHGCSHHGRKYCDAELFQKEGSVDSKFSSQDSWMRWLS